ncbi:hypothetical protein HYZ99_00885 [Candidatus Peregrinibacteria bacterium]|nr:hypothetical protein [Candidatus Peregrinibacteria bacterium]
MTKYEAAMQIVYELYALQVRLWELLDADLSDPNLRKEAKKQTKIFESLLQSADWRYMGGEDVYESLKQLPEEVTVKLKMYTVKTGKVVN